MSRPARYTYRMTKLSDRVSRLMENPKTKRMIDKAKVTANKPENREKLGKMSSKITGKMRKSRGHDEHVSPPADSTSFPSGPSGSPPGPSA